MTTQNNTPKSGTERKLLTYRHELIPVGEVLVTDRLRETRQEQVDQIIQSFTHLDAEVLIHPITVTRDYSLVDGAHRLEAAKQSGWTHIAAMVVDVDRALASQMEIVANNARAPFSLMELEKAWVERYLPTVDERKRLAREAGVRFSLRRFALTTVGVSVDSLSKLAVIRKAAHHPSLPEPIKVVAVRAFRELSDPKNRGVDRNYRLLLGAKSAFEEGLSPDSVEQVQRSARVSSVLESADRFTRLLSTDGVLDDLVQVARQDGAELGAIVSSRRALEEVVSRLREVEESASATSTSIGGL